MTNKGKALCLFGFDIDDDIAGACGDLAFAAGGCFRHLYVACGGVGDENLIRQQEARYVACGGFDADVGSVAAFEPDAARTALDTEIFFGDRVRECDIAGRRLYGDIALCRDRFKTDVARGGLDRRFSGFCVME